MKSPILVPSSNLGIYNWIYMDVHAYSRPVYSDETSTKQIKDAHKWGYVYALCYSSLFTSI